MEANRKFTTLLDAAKKEMEYLEHAPNSTRRPTAFLRDVVTGKFFNHRSFPHVKTMYSFLSGAPRIDHLFVSPSP